MRKALRITALALALVMLAALSGCGKDNKPDPGPEKGGEKALSEEETARAEELASAFRLFGECDIEKGIELRTAERMIFCMYTGSLEESDTAGYGVIDADEADGMLMRIFSGFDAKGMFRTKYKEGEEQELYYSDGRYFVKLTDLSAYTYSVTAANELVDKDGKRIGDVITVSVMKDGAREATIRLELADSEQAVYSIRKCSIDYVD